MKKVLSGISKQNRTYIAILLVVAVVSIFVLAPIFSTPSTYRKTIASIDEKKGDAMLLTATTAAAATTLAVIPGDATTPIADQILDMSGYLMAVVCALVLEKSLLTVFGAISFKILIPIFCVLHGIYVFKRNENILKLAIKFLIFAIALTLVIPVGISVGDMIYDANYAVIERVNLEETEKLEDDAGEKNWIEKFFDKIKDSTTEVVEKAKNLLNDFVDAIAVFVITCCAIPIIIVLLIVWLVNVLFHTNIPIPKAIRISKLLAQKEKNKFEE